MKLAAGIDIGAECVISALPLRTKRAVGRSVGHGMSRGLPYGLLVVRVLKT